MVRLLGHLYFLGLFVGCYPLGGPERAAFWSSLEVLHIYRLVFTVRPRHPFPDIFLFQEWRLRLLVLVPDFRVGRAEVVHSADVDLSGGVLGQVVHDVVAHILHVPEATEGYPTDRIDTDVVQKSHRYGISNIFENLLREGRLVRVGVYLRVGVGHRRLLLDHTVRFYQFGSECVDAAAVVVVAFQSVAVREAGRLLEGNPAAAFSTHAVFVLDSHDLLREIALVHVEVEAVHGDQLGEGDVVSLALVVWEGVSEDKHSLLRGMGVKIDVAFQVVVLLGELCHEEFGGPNGRLLLLERLSVEPIEILAEGVQTVVSSCDAVWVERWYDFEDKVFSQ